GADGLWAGEPRQRGERRVGVGQARPTVSPNLESRSWVRPGGLDTLSSLADGMAPNDFPGQGDPVGWRTSSADRGLGGKEQTLFVHAAATLMDYLLEEAKGEGSDPDCARLTGVCLFDGMGPPARITLLRDVVHALSDPAVPTGPAQRGPAPGACSRCQND